MKKLIILSILAGMFAFAAPVQAQVKSLNKVAKKAGDSVKETAKETANETATSAKETAGDAATSAKEAAYDKAANKVSVKIVKWLDDNNKVASDSYTKRLNSLVSPKYTSVDGLKLNYKAYTSEEANIIACADGSIRVYTGMMDLLDDDQLLAVIAVQIGHIKNKDVRNSLMKVASEENADNAAAAQLEKMLSLSGDKLGTVVNELIQIPYTAAQNTAADNYAYSLLEKNGANASGLSSALSKFADLEKEKDGVATKYTTVNSNNKKRASAVSAVSIK